MLEWALRRSFQGAVISRITPQGAGEGFAMSSTKPQPPDVAVEITYCSE